MAQNQEKLASFMDSLSSTAAYSDELRVIAAAYIMEQVAGTKQGSLDLLHRLLQSQRMEVRNGGTPAPAGEYERADLLADLMHEGFVHSVEKGLCVSDTCALVRILTGMLRWVLSCDRVPADGECFIPTTTL